MPLLDRNGSKADDWTRSEGAAIGNIPRVLVPWEALDEALAGEAPGQRIGVAIPNSLATSALEPYLPQLDLVAIAFPAFSDGRGFSIARRLRRAGFKGILRASGPLSVDQFAYALSCGFDELEVPEASAQRQPVEQWLRWREQFSATYQRGYADPSRNILDRRRAARLQPAS